jgi:hypothetical protein
MQLEVPLVPGLFEAVEGLEELERVSRRDTDGAFRELHIDILGDVAVKIRGRDIDAPKLEVFQRSKCEDKTEGRPFRCWRKRLGEVETGALGISFCDKAGFVSFDCSVSV